MECHSLAVGCGNSSSQNVECHSLAGGHRKRCDETAFHKNVQCHSLAVGLCDETVFHKICNVTHKLSVRGKDLMRQY